MSSYKKVCSKYQEVRENKYREVENKAKIVGTPLNFLGNLIFKPVFSQVLGFEWLLDLTDKLHLAGINIEVPSITYEYGYFKIDPFGKLVSRTALVSGFVISHNSYTVTPLNFLAVLLNYIFRNLGKLIGYILVSPFTVPAYLIIKAIYKIKDWMLRNDYKKSLSQLDDATLINGWVNNPGSSFANERYCQTYCPR